MNRIKILREQKGLSQSQLGKELNVQTAAVSKYENGIVSLNEVILKKLSTLFECSIDYIVCNDYFLDTTETPLSKLSNQEIELIAEYRALDITKQQFLSTIMAFLRSSYSNVFGNITQTNSGDNSFLAIGNGNTYAKNKGGC